MAFYDMTWRAISIGPYVQVSKTRLKDDTLKWVRGAGLRPKDIAWEDAARAVCAGAGMLARDHDGNECTFVLERLMTLLERHMMALNTPGAPHPVGTDG